MKAWAAFSLLVLLAVSACGQDMVDQQKQLPYAKSHVFRDGKVNQAPPAGTVARDDAAWREALTRKPPLTRALIERGRQRYNIYCEPCHGLVGDGDGIIPRHGFPHPPSYFKPALLNAPASHFVDVISHGHGVMFSYADRVAPADRWAIAAWIRVLQYSQHTPAKDLPTDMRRRLDQEAAGAPE